MTWVTKPQLYQSKPITYDYKSHRRVLRALETGTVFENKIPLELSTVNAFMKKAIQERKLNVLEFMFNKELHLLKVAVNFQSFTH